MTGWLISEFWPLILGGLGVIWGMWNQRRIGKEKAARQAAERNAKTQKEMRDHEREASQLDDTSLADRLSRRD